MITRWPEEKAMFDISEGYDILVLPNRIWYGDGVPQDVREKFEQAYAAYLKRYEAALNKVYGLDGE